MNLLKHAERMHRAISSTVTSFAGLQIQQKRYTSLKLKLTVKFSAPAKSTQWLEALIVLFSLLSTRVSLGSSF